MHVSLKNQKTWTKEGFYGGEGTIEGRAAIGFGNPRAEGSKVKTTMQMIIPKSSTVGEHIHPNEDELYVVLSGKAIHTTEGEEYEIAQGDVVLTVAGQKHSIKPISENGIVLQATLIEK